VWLVIGIGGHQHRCVDCTSDSVSPTSFRSGQSRSLSL